MRRKQQLGDDEEKERGSNSTEAGLQTFSCVCLVLPLSIVSCESVSSAESCPSRSLLSFRFLFDLG